jgi:PAS domain S-box-containing protein
LKYRELIEFAVDGILMIAKDGIITTANTYMQTLTGRTEENLIGTNVDQLFHPDHLKEVPFRFDLVERGDMVVSRRDLLRPDGTLVPVEMHTKMMPDGSYQSIYHDITNRKQAEQKLTESRALYKLITDKMTDVVWLMDLNKKSIFVSKSIEQFTGFTVDEYLQQSLDERFTPDSAAMGKALFERELKRLYADPEILRGFSYTLQMEYKCKDGSTKWGELLISGYFGENKEWLGIHGVTRDITGRRQTEDALKEKANELERFNSLMIGRELKMIELKKEINALLVQANKDEKYKVHEK